MIMQKIKQFIASLKGINKRFEKKKNDDASLENPIDLIWSVNKALWCEVRPNMRQVSAEYIKEEKRFILYIFWDKPMTVEEDNYSIAGTILTEIGCDFFDPE